MKDLLWIEGDGPQMEGRKRQYLMVNYLDKKSAGSAGIDGLKPSKHAKSSRAKASPTYRRKNSGRTAQPATALVNRADQEVYQAAWYHALRPEPIQPLSRMSWRNQCRAEWSYAFWDFARQDETLLEMFLTFAAAKEAATRGTSCCRAYYMHKGKALTLVSQDIRCEGQSLRTAAVVAICLLSKAAFIEGDYATVEQHNSALVSLTRYRLSCVPSFLWLLIAWADLRLIAVTLRAPMMPYFVHPDYRVKLTPEEVVKARTRALYRATDLPQHGVLTVDAAQILLERLYEVAIVSNNGQTSYVVAWTVAYETSFHLAQLEAEFQRTRCADRSCDCDLVHLAITAARIQFWVTLSSFMPQQGAQRHLLETFTSEVTGFEPASVLDRWDTVGSIDSLLWVLTNACALLVHPNGFNADLPATSQEWLLAILDLVISRLDLASSEDFELHLRKWPFSELFNGMARRPVYEWMQGREIPRQKTHTDTHNLAACFADFRLTFDPMQE